jgi:hypothetical protein
MKHRDCRKRRNFLKMTAAGTAGIALTGGLRTLFAAPSPRTAAGTAPLNKWPGRVVINFNKNAPGSTGTDATAAQVTIIKTMVDDSIKLLTGQADVGAAWRSLFPAALSLTSKILIKVPCGFNNSLSVPHWSSVQAITEGLQKMQVGTGTFPAANITIFDGTGTNNLSSRGFTAAHFPSVNIVFYSSGSSSFAAFSDSPKNNSDASMPYATVLNTADFLINVFSPRGHGDYAGNFTLGFKNHYGTFNAPSLPHGAPDTGQILRAINCTGTVYAKNVLSVCSGIWGQYEGNGPGGSPQNYSTYSKHMDPTSTNTTPTTIILGTDPVSVEMQTIKMMRIQGGKTFAVADMPSYLKASGGIAVTGNNWPPDPAKPDVMDDIGVIDESKMSVYTILNGVDVTGVAHEPLSRREGGAAAVAARQVAAGCTSIEFKLPADRAGTNATLSIFDARGARVRQLAAKVLGVVNRASWDETGRLGGRVPRGMYVVRLESGTISVSSGFGIVR